MGFIISEIIIEKMKQNESNMAFSTPRYSLTYLKYDIKYFLTNCKYLVKYRLRRAKKRNILYFVFEPSIKHPGLADRLKAVVSLYNVAKRDGLDFKFYYKDPFDLSDYFAHRLDWRMELSDLEYSLIDTRIINECNWRPIKALSHNKQYQCYCYAGNDIPWKFADTGYKWSELFNELFKPSDKLLAAYNVLCMDKKPYISVHLRFVNALEKFENTFFDNFIEDEEERKKLILKCKNGIREIISENKDKLLYVFSDSKLFLDSCTDIPVKTLKTDNIGHVSEKSSTDVYLKTFLDLYVMSKSDVIYRIKAKEIYNLSCFALLASRINDVKFIDKNLD